MTDTKVMMHPLYEAFTIYYNKFPKQHSTQGKILQRVSLYFT